MRISGGMLIEMQVEKSRVGALCSKVVKVRNVAVEFQFSHHEVWGDGVLT